VRIILHNPLRRSSRPGHLVVAARQRVDRAQKNKTCGIHVTRFILHVPRCPFHAAPAILKTSHRNTQNTRPAAVQLLSLSLPPALATSFWTRLTIRYGIFPWNGNYGRHCSSITTIRLFRGVSFAQLQKCSSGRIKVPSVMPGWNMYDSLARNSMQRPS
jgi:hypothetical protein